MDGKFRGFPQKKENESPSGISTAIAGCDISEGDFLAVEYDDLGKKTVRKKFFNNYVDIRNGANGSFITDAVGINSTIKCVDGTLSLKVDYNQTNPVIIHRIITEDGIVAGKTETPIYFSAAMSSSSYNSVALGQLDTKTYIAFARLSNNNVEGIVFNIINNEICNITDSFALLSSVADCIKAISYNDGSIELIYVTSGLKGVHITWQGGTTFSVGTPYTISTPYSIKPCVAYKNGQAFIVFASVFSPYYVSLIKGTYSNGVMTWGTPNEITTITGKASTTNLFPYCVDIIETDKIVFSYENAYVVTATFSGNTPTIGTAIQISNSTTDGCVFLVVKRGGNIIAVQQTIVTTGTPHTQRVVELIPKADNTLELASGHHCLGDNFYNNVTTNPPIIAGDGLTMVGDNAALFDYFGLTMVIKNKDGAFNLPFEIGVMNNANYAQITRLKEENYAVIHRDYDNSSLFNFYHFEITKEALIKIVKKISVVSSVNLASGTSAIELESYENGAYNLLWAYYYDTTELYTRTITYDGSTIQLGTTLVISSPGIPYNERMSLMKYYKGKHLLISHNNNPNVLNLIVNWANKTVTSTQYSLGVSGYYNAFDKAEKRITLIAPGTGSIRKYYPGSTSVKEIFGGVALATTKYGFLSSKSKVYASIQETSSQLSIGVWERVSAKKIIIESITADGNSYPMTNLTIIGDVLIAFQKNSSSSYGFVYYIDTKTKELIRKSPLVFGSGSIIADTAAVPSYLPDDEDKNTIPILNTTNRQVTVALRSIDFLQPTVIATKAARKGATVQIAEQGGIATVKGVKRGGQYQLTPEGELTPSSTGSQFYAVDNDKLLIL